jgi:flagellar motor switch protein FliN/FliY
MKPHQTTVVDDMTRLGDIFITIRAELDQTTLTFADLLSLEAGSLIQLSRPTGENIDIYAEEALIGWGEVLLMDGALMVRLSDLRNAALPGFANEELETAADAGEEEMI